MSAVSVSLAAATIDVGAATTASAAIAQQNCSGLTPTWSAEPAGVATVSSSGTVTGVTAGTATIRAVVNGVAGTATLTVRSVCTVTGVTVAPPQSTIFVSNTVALTATVAQQGCTGNTILWESLHPAIATVANGVVTGVTPGTATIRATVTGVTPVVSGTAQVVVEAQPLGASWITSRLVVSGGTGAPSGDFRSVAAFGPNAVFVGGANGVHRYDGAQWTRIKDPTQVVHGLWGTAANDLFAVGGGGLIERYNGTTWTPMATGTTTETLRGIWGAGPSAVFAVGTGGIIRRFNGTAWLAEASPTTQWLYSVAGSGASNVFAVGDGGVILRYDGATWTQMASPVTDLITAVWVAGPTSAFAVTIAGQVLRWDGATWSVTTTLNGALPLGIWGTSATDLYVVGGHGYAAHFDGATWTAFDSRIGYSLEGLAGAGTTAYAVGNSSVVALNGTAPTRLVYVPDLRSVWAFDRDNAVAVTDVGILWRYVAGVWSFFETGTRDRFYDVWASGPADIVAVGGIYPFSGGAAVSRFNGAAWTTGTIAGSPYLATVWGAGANNVYSLGGFDAARRFDGAVWSPLATGVFGTIEAVWGTGATDILGVGRNGTTLRWNGTAWVVGSLGTTEAAGAVWGTSPTNYFAGTESGKVLRFDGATWTQVHSLGTTVRGLAGTGPSDILALGYSSEIARFNGTGWQLIHPGVSTEVAMAIHGAGGRYFVVGGAGLVKMTP